MKAPSSNAFVSYQHKIFKKKKSATALFFNWLHQGEKSILTLSYTD